MSEGLRGKRVLVTRPIHQAERTADLLRARGALPVLLPTIAILSLADGDELRSALARAGEYDFVIFTSDNGVRVTCEQEGAPARLAQAKLAVIGPGTAHALEPFGLRATVIAEEHRGEGMADALLAFPPSRALLLRARDAREVLPETLRRHGWTVDVVAVYETRPAEESALAALARTLESGGVDAVTLTSASTIASLCNVLGTRAQALLAKVRVVSIGPITSQAARDLGIRIDAEAASATLGGLLDAVEAAFRVPEPPAG